MLKLMLLDIAEVFWFGAEEAAVEVNCALPSCQQSYEVTQRSYKVTEAGVFAVSHVGCFSSVQSSPVAQSCPTLCDPMNRSTPGLPVSHQLPKFTQTHVHRVGDAIQPSHPLSSPSPPVPNPSQHQGLFQWVNSSHRMFSIAYFTILIILSNESYPESKME